MFNIEQSKIISTASIRKVTTRHHLWINQDIIEKKMFCHSPNSFSSWDQHNMQSVWHSICFFDNLIRSQETKHQREKFLPGKCRYWSECRMIFQLLLLRFFCCWRILNWICNLISIIALKASLCFHLAMFSLCVLLRRSIWLTYQTEVDVFERFSVIRKRMNHVFELNIDEMILCRKNLRVDFDDLHCLFWNEMSAWYMHVTHFLFFSLLICFFTLYSIEIKLFIIQKSRMVLFN